MSGRPKGSITKRSLTPDVLPPLRQDLLAGYDPAGLDPIIGGLLTAGQQAASTFEEMVPLLRQAATALKTVLDAKAPTLDALAFRANQASNVVEKASQVIVQLTKALDGLSRLRSFLSGGPDHRAELIQGMSERELLALILKAAGKCPRCGALLGEGL